jgi:hypothetical protein
MLLQIRFFDHLAVQIVSSLFFQLMDGSLHCSIADRVDAHIG